MITMASAPPAVLTVDDVVSLSSNSVSRKTKGVISSLGTLKVVDANYNNVLIATFEEQNLPNCF